MRLSPAAAGAGRPALPIPAELGANAQGFITLGASAGTVRFLPGKPTATYGYSRVRIDAPGPFEKVLYSFTAILYALVMSEMSYLRPASPEEIADALSFALRYRGRKRVFHADDIVARITADRLVQHLTASGFVLMKGSPAAALSTSGMPSAKHD